VTPENIKIALHALESHFLTGSLDSDKFLHLSAILRERPDDFWPEYFSVFSPPSEEAKALLQKIGPDAKLSVLAERTTQEIYDHVN